MPELSAAGLWSTPNDLATFGLEIMKALRGHSKLLKKETVERMISPVNPICGLGFFVSEMNGKTCIGHRGANTGYHSGIAFFPDDGNGVTVMVNAHRGDSLVTLLLEAIKKSIYDK